MRCRRRVRAQLMPVNHAYGALVGQPETLPLDDFHAPRDMEPSLWGRVSDASAHGPLLIGGPPPTGVAPEVAGSITSAVDELHSMQLLLDSAVVSGVVDVARLRLHAGDALRHLTAADRGIGALLAAHAKAIARPVR